METLTEVKGFSEAQVSDLLAGSANHEIKALTIASMEPGGVYTPTALRNEVMGYLGAGDSRMVSHSTTRSYCRDSFIPAGFVQEITSPITGGVAFVLTDSGETVGRALAGHALDLSLRAGDDVSLRRIAGLSHSRIESERPPYRRFEILRSLMANGQMSHAELFTATRQGDYSTSLHRVHMLAEDGLVEIDLLQPRGVEYELLSIAALKQHRQRKYTGITQAIDLAMNDVAEIAPKATFWAKEVAAYVIENLGFPDNPTTYKNVAGKLNRLARVGVIGKLNIDEQQDLMITVAPSLLQTITSYVELVENLIHVSPDFIDSGLAKVDRILSEPKLVNTLLEKGLANSPQATSSYASGVNSPLHR